MTYFAQIVEDLVTEVIVVNDDIVDGAKFCNETFGGEWVQTFMNTANKNYASVGDTYDAANQNFIAPQPYPSWVLNSNDQWQAPVPQPQPPPQTHWNEQLQEWIPYDF